VHQFGRQIKIVKALLTLSRLYHILIKRPSGVFFQTPRDLNIRQSAAGTVRLGIGIYAFAALGALGVTTTPFFGAWPCDRTGCRCGRDRRRGLLALTAFAARLFAPRALRGVITRSRLMPTITLATRRPVSTAGSIPTAIRCPRATISGFASMTLGVAAVFGVVTIPTAFFPLRIASAPRRGISVFPLTLIC